MRTLFATAALLLSAPVFAGDGFLGTKSSPSMGPMQGDTGGVGVMSFLQMMVALGIVLLLLKFVMPKLVTKLNKRIVTKVGSGIHIEESAAFAGGTLYIVNAKSKTLLLSVTSQGVSCLSDLTTDQGPAPTFQEIVEREIDGPMQPFAVVDHVAPADEAQSAAAALERLTRLAG